MHCLRRAMPRCRIDRFHYYLRGRTRGGTARRSNATYCEPSLIRSSAVVRGIDFYFQDPDLRGLNESWQISVSVSVQSSLVCPDRTRPSKTTVGPKVR